MAEEAENTVVALEEKNSESLEGENTVAAVNEGENVVPAAAEEENIPVAAGVEDEMGENAIMDDVGGDLVGQDVEEEEEEEEHPQVVEDIMQNLLAEAVIAHWNDPLHQCPVCSKRFGTVLRMIQHRRYVHGW